jgi:histidinol dehydrogenase
VELKAAIYLAQKNIETFHAAQRFTGKRWKTMEGVLAGKRQWALRK